MDYLNNMEEHGELWKFVFYKLKKVLLNTTFFRLIFKFYISKNNKSFNGTRKNVESFRYLCMKSF